MCQRSLIRAIAPIAPRTPNEPAKRRQHEGAEEGDHGRADEVILARECHRQQAQDEKADHGADQTERDVGEAAEAMAAHNQAGQPAGNARRDDPRDAAARVQGDVAESKRRQRRQMFDAHAAHSNTTSRLVVTSRPTLRLRTRTVAWPTPTPSDRAIIVRYIFLKYTRHLCRRTRHGWLRPPHGCRRREELYATPYVRWRDWASAATEGAAARTHMATYSAAAVATDTTSARSYAAPAGSATSGSASSGCQRFSHSKVYQPS